MGLVLAGLLTICLLGATLARGQTGAAAPAAQKPILSEQAFKDVQVLRGIPVKEFMETMGFFAAALSLNCTDCHGEASGSSWASYADDTPLKQTSRRMILMVNAINKRQLRRGTRRDLLHLPSRQPEAEGDPEPGAAVLRAAGRGSR